MIKLNENNIGKFNLISTFTILIIFATTISILSIYSRISDFKLLQTEVKNEFIKKKKEDIKYRVLNINRLIINQNEKVLLNLKSTIKERVNNSYEITSKIYDKYHKIKSSQEIINIIKETLRPIRYDDGIGYIFIASLDGIELLYPVAPEFENTDILNLQDAKGNFVIKEEIKIAKEIKEGFIQEYWTKPNAPDTHMIYPKITFIKSFEKLNIYIGSGMYIDDVTKKSQIYIKDLVTQLNKQNPKDYFVISKLLNIDGGDKFAKILVHPTAPIGKVIGDEKKDLYGKDYRKEYLKGLKQNGETYLNYSFKHPQTKEEMSKISYFILNKQWNWIIGTGFYDDIIDNEISSWENNLNKLIKENIYTHISLLALFSLILFFIIFFINKFTQNTIQKYKKNVKEKESELNRLNNNLEIKVKSEVTKNTLAQEQLFKSEKLASMGEMIGNIAHQWRQPLSVISTSATGIIAQKEFNLITDEQLIETCDTINEHAQYLSRTIDDFKNFIKGDRVKSHFNLSENINSFLHLIDSITKTQQINVILDLKADITINAYPTELIQCLINIYNNAKDALVSREQNKRYIFIATKQTKDNVIIIIKDNAHGIPKDILQKIFEPYFTTKHKSQGTGLGLHMTYTLITSGMNGTIDAKNVEYIYNEQEFKGAEFTITLPLS